MKRLSDSLVELLNLRIKQELESAYLYEAMANCLDFKGYSNAAKVYRKDAEDERTHAKWAVEYMLTMDVEPITPTIEAPKQQEWKDIKELVDATVTHEYFVTDECNKLAKSALLESDFITHQFVASKYLAEQVEELEKIHERQKYMTLYAGDNFAIEHYFEDQLG